MYLSVDITDLVLSNLAVLRENFILKGAGPNNISLCRNEQQGGAT